MIGIVPAARRGPVARGLDNLAPAFEPSLLRKLNTAKQSPDTDCRLLGAVITQVRGESGARIPAAEADDLATQTEEVRDSLNCWARVGTCAGRTATIVGTSGADKLRGTKGADVIAAGGGDDRVVGLGGDDLMCGGAGADVIRGGSGDDRLRGGRGSDRCRGGGGSDSKRHC